MNDQSIIRKPAPVCVTNFNAKAEGEGVVLRFSMRNIQVWKGVIERIESSGFQEWKIDHTKSKRGSRVEVLVSDQSVASVVDRVHAMNIQSVRPGAP